MTPSREPNEAAISGVVGITGLQREDAVKWLKAYNEDPNKAVSAWLDNPSAIHNQQSQVDWDERQGWQEDHFHTGRPDSAQQGQNQLGVRPTDTLRPGVFSDAAPSRPPSRVSTRAMSAANGKSAHYGRSSGLRADEKIKGASQNLAMDSEDDQLNKAIAMSMSDSQTLPSQETGVHDFKAFGPATREHYETEKWAMTIAGPHTQEILLNPEPLDRKRSTNTPAFLKPSPSGHRLPALLKILHAIPMAREALLNRDIMLPDYGHDKDWWDGSAIKFLKIVNLDLEGRQVNNDDVIHETQRLMAFLDETERAYGSTDVLADIEGTGDFMNDKTVDFFQRWCKATARSAPDAPLTNTFRSTGTKISPEVPQSKDFYCLVAKIDDEISGKGLTLYDALDHILWADKQEEEEVFLENVANVFTLEVGNQVAGGAGLGIEIPAIWYADRYQPSSTKQMRDMLSRKSKVHTELESQEKAQKRMTQCVHATDGTSIDATRLLSKTTAYFEQTAAYRNSTNERSASNSMSEDLDNDSAVPGQIAEGLRALTETISQKLEAFKKVRGNARKKLKEISQIYTKPSENPAEPPHHKFTLRGVSTTPHTLYVLEKTKPEHKDDMLSTEAKDWQWWKIKYVSNATQPIALTKVTEDDVLKAAGSESPDALLIYASEAAVAYKCEDLPAQLHNFVRVDNLMFGAELEGANNRKPTTPTKRKVDDEDSDDLETHCHRSPPYDRSLVDTALSNDDMDLNSPGYHSSSSPPPGLAHRSSNPRRAGTGTYDDVIPTSLRATEPMTDSTSMVLDQEGMSLEQEMQERGGGSRSLLKQQSGSKEQYTLGSCVSKITMEDDEEDEDQRGSRGG